MLAVSTIHLSSLPFFMPNYIFIFIMCLCNYYLLFWFTTSNYPLLFFYLSSGLSCHNSFIWTCLNHFDLFSLIFQFNFIISKFRSPISPSSFSLRPLLHRSKEGEAREGKTDARFSVHHAWYATAPPDPNYLPLTGCGRRHLLLFFVLVRRGCQSPSALRL